MHYVRVLLLCRVYGLLNGSWIKFFVIVVAASRLALVFPRFGMPLITGSVGDARWSSRCGVVLQPRRCGWLLEFERTRGVLSRALTRSLTRSRIVAALHSSLRNFSRSQLHGDRLHLRSLRAGPGVQAADPGPLLRDPDRPGLYRFLSGQRALPARAALALQDDRAHHGVQRALLLHLLHALHLLHRGRGRRALDGTLPGRLRVQHQSRGW